MRAGLLYPSLLLATVCWAVEAISAPGDIPPAPTATALSDPSRWRFVGCAAFPVDQLRDELSANLDVIAASRSSGTIDKLIEVVTRELTLGYRSVGYPDATVTADVDRNARQLVITVDEGKLTLQGKVEVRGATTIDADGLIAGVKQKYAPADAIPVFFGKPGVDEAFLRWVKSNGQPEKLNDPIWNPGKPASFAPSVWKAMEPLVQLYLKRQGYADPFVSVSVEQSEDGTATLVITVRDEGPRILLGEIEVTGNERNSTEDILEFLQLKVGQPFDAMRQARLHWQLKQAARFLKHDVQLSSPPVGDGPSRLTLTLIAAPRVPALNEQFTPEQQVAIRAANWLSTQREYDWVISSHAKPTVGKAPPAKSSVFGNRETFGRMILSPKDGSALFEATANDADERLIWGQVLCVGRNSGWLLAPHRHTKLEWNGFAGTLILRVALLATPPDSHGHMVQMLFGAGLNSDSKTDGAPIRDEFSIEPLAMLLDLTRESTRVDLTGDRMTVSAEAYEMVIDVPTGRPITWRFGFGDESVNVSLEKGAHAEAARKWEGLRDVSRNGLLKESPITSILQYVGEEARVIEKLQSELLPTWFRLAERLVNSGVLRPVDEAFAKLSNDDNVSTASFSIPVEPNPKSPLGTFAWLEPMIRSALPYYAKVFPRDTPGWTIGREAALMLLRPKGVEIPSPLGMAMMLEDDQAGPVHFLLAAGLYGVASPLHRYVLANRGLRELSPEAFRRDVAALLNEKGVASHSANAIAALLRGLDEPDLNDLAELLNLEAEDRALVTSLLKQLIRRRDEPANILLPELAEEVWPVLRPRIETGLRNLATPPVAPTREPQRVTEKPGSPTAPPLPE